MRTFFNRFWPKSNWSTKHFLFDLNLELHSGLKVRGSEINFINKKLLKSKNPRGFVIPVLKVEVTNPRGFFDSSNFLLIKLISDPLTLRPLCSSRFRLNKKCLADQLLLGQNLLKNVLNRKTFLNWRPLTWKQIIFWSSFSRTLISRFFLHVLASKEQKMKDSDWLLKSFCQSESRHPEGLHYMKG